MRYTVLLSFLIFSCSAPSDYAGQRADTVINQPAMVEPPFRIVRHNGTADEFAQYVHVQVENTSSELIQYLELKGVWQNESGQIVGTGMGNAVNIGPGQTKTIDVMGMDIHNAQTYNVEVVNFY